MPTRYGRPDATMRTLPHRQPPVNRSMLRLLQDQAVGLATTFQLPGARQLGESRDAFRAYAPPCRTGAALDPLRRVGCPQHEESAAGVERDHEVALLVAAVALTTSPRGFAHRRHKLLETPRRLAWAARASAAARLSSYAR